MDYEQRVIIRFLHREGTSAEEIHARLQAQFGPDSYSLRSVRRWCQYVRQGREDLHDEARPGRPPMDFLDIKIIACLDKEPFHSAYSLAEALKVSHSTVLNRLHDSLGMKNFHLRWIPHALTQSLRESRIEKCRELLPILEGMEKVHFHTLVTGDESWFTLEFQHSTKWCLSRDDVPQKPSHRIDTAKFMLTVMWGVAGFHVIDLMTTQRTFNSQYFVENVMTPLVSKIFPHGRRSHATRLHCHLDNCRVHFSKVSEHFFAENEIVRVPQPPYSPDLAPSDFWLFGHMKASLAGRSFSGPEELLDGINAFLEEIQEAELKIVFQHWIERVKWVLAHDGEYYQE